MDYREMKDARDASVAARNTKDAERMARIYRARPEGGSVAFVAGLQRVEFSPKRCGTGVGGNAYFRKMWSKFMPKDKADRRMYRKAAAKAVKGALPSSPLRDRNARRARKAEAKRLALAAAAPGAP